MQMSFLGSIDHLNAGSGLQVLIEIMFAVNAVEHTVAMLSREQFVATC